MQALACISPLCLSQTRSPPWHLLSQGCCCQELAWWNLVPPFVGPNIAKPAHGHRSRAERGEFPTSITPWPATFSLGPLSPQDVHLVRFGVFSMFLRFPWFFLFAALRCLCPEVGKKWEAGEKWEISLSLGLLASKPHADAAAGAVLTCSHVRLHLSHLSFRCAPSDAVFQPHNQIFYKPWEDRLETEHRRDVLQNIIRSIRKQQNSLSFQSWQHRGGGGTQTYRAL